MAESLADKAKSAISLAKIAMRYLSDDELSLNYVGYLLQQAVELSVKNMIEIGGAEAPRIHDIDQLLIFARDKDIPVYTTAYIEAHSERFSAWEAKTRYVIGYRVEREKLEETIPEAERYVDFCRVLTRLQTCGYSIPEEIKKQVSGASLLQYVAGKYYIPKEDAALFREFGVAYIEEKQTKREKKARGGDLTL